KAAVAELTRIHEALKKSPTFPDALAESLSNLRDAEERLRGEVESLAREKFDGLPVFADFLKQAADALDEAARQIDRRVKARPGADQPLAEADREEQEAAQRAARKPAETALRRLTQLLDAVKDEKQDRSAARPPGGGQRGGAGGGGGGGGGA